MNGKNSLLPRLKKKKKKRSVEEIVLKNVRRFFQNIFKLFMQVAK